MQATAIQIAPATPEDVPLLLSMIGELAAYEKLEHQVVANELSLHDALFGPKPVVAAVIARVGASPAGFAIYFHNFSTFLGKPGLYLEDLFVRPEFRGRAIGKGLLVYLAGLAVAENCERFDWAVLDWNQPAQKFYESLGAEANAAWINYRISGDALRRLAAGGA
jgi:GNAT superfamily N-acetyltransferase